MVEAWLLKGAHSERLRAFRGDKASKATADPNSLWSRAWSAIGGGADLPQHFSLSRQPAKKNVVSFADLGELGSSALAIPGDRYFLATQFRIYPIKKTGPQLFAHHAVGGDRSRRRTDGQSRRKPADLENQLLANGDRKVLRLVHRNHE